MSTQRTLAGQIETLLLAETPIIFGYFYNYLTATAKSVTGVYPTAIGHLFLYKRPRVRLLCPVRCAIRGAPHRPRAVRAAGEVAPAWSATARRGKAAPMATEKQARTESHGRDGGHHHRDVSGGWLRPAVFGAMDGLVTNASLIAGVGGGGASAHTIVLTGLAGLAAGAGSMAAGEYVSVSSQNELIYSEVNKERLELENNAAFEQAELATMLRPAASAPPPRGRPPRRSRRTRKRRWPCTRWRN